MYLLLRNKYGALRRSTLSPLSRQLLLIFVLAIGAFLPHVVSADSNLTWASPWVVTITPNCTDYSFPFRDECLGSRGFGENAFPETVRGTEDEQAVAWMNSGGRVRGTLLVGAIDFYRDFILRGPGTEWDVTLNGLLTGGTTLFNPRPQSEYSFGANSSVSVTADITSIANGTRWLPLSYSNTVRNTSGHPIDRIEKGYDLPLSTNGILPGGNYRISGQLRGSHVTSYAAGEWGGASYQWTVSAAATPIPEPSTWLVLATGFVALLFLRKQFVP